MRYDENILKQVHPINLKLNHSIYVDDLQRIYGKD